MEAMVDDQGNVVVSQANSHNVVTTVSGQTIAVPTASGAVSIVQVVPNQSVIQQNQQSVIQTTPGALQAVQLSKGNVILLNKGASSVIQSAAGNSPLQTVQVVSESDEGTAEEEGRKRREILARRPSYRKILNDLSSVDQSVMGGDIKDEDQNAGDSSQDDIPNTITVAGMRVAVVPAGAIQITGSQNETIQGLQTLTMTNSGNAGAGAIVQYAQGQDGQFFVPVTVSAADLQAYQIRGATSTGALTSGVVMAPSNQTPQQVAEEASRKRELRLLKNREAARECRRKKKEYIKCLENRVAVLENQNKALIEELKSLKELYCQKNE